MNALAEQVLSKLGTIIVLLDEQGRAEYVSPSTHDVLGFTPGQLIGDGWMDLTRFAESDRIIAREHFDRMRKSAGAHAQYERLLRTAYGGKKWILWNTTPTPEGKLIGIGYDITERKRQEELLVTRTRDLDERNKEMESSLRYAQRIQEAILPSVAELRRSFRDAFVFNRPKDIVSGDFWWHYPKGDFVYVAAVDCTGHGVPGALMSVLAHSIFREVFINRGIEEPSEILAAIDRELFAALNREHIGQPYPDGMDVALCRFDRKKKQLQFAGAYRPLIVVPALQQNERDVKFIEYPASRYPIGFYSDAVKQFTTWTVELQDGDTCYIFSDGYADQFGGEPAPSNGKKLNKRRFRELLCTLHSMNAEEQESFLEYALVNWKQDQPQTDDVLVIGLQV